MDQNWYKILQVQRDADRDTIDAAYRRLALQYHPDLNQSRNSNELMKLINAAYSVLCNPIKRSAFDREYIPTTPYKPVRTRTVSRKVQPEQEKKPSSDVFQEQIILFHIAHQSYALPIENVVTVMMNQPPVHIPEMPDFLEGAVEFQDTAIPLVDLGKHFGQSPSQLEKQARIVVVEIEGVQTGLIVEKVDNFLKVPDNTILSSRSMFNGDQLGFIKGYMHIGFDLVILINLAGLFNADQTNVLKLFLELKQENN